MQPILPGPPGTITGRVLFERGIQPQPFTVYAFREVDSSPGPVYYAMTRVEAPTSNYELGVPPGGYRVVARLDTDHTRFAGYTANVACAHNNCLRGTSLSFVRVDSQAVVQGIDVGDWGTAENELYGWAIDTNGASLFDPTQPSPTPTIPPTRVLPAVPDSALSWASANPALSMFGLPPGWHEVTPPFGRSIYFQYYSNEPVQWPLELDSNGAWLVIRRYGPECPNQDWRFVVGVTTVQMDGGPEAFYFADPPGGGTAPQPFIGYRLAGGTWHEGIGLGGGVSCIWFDFRGATRQALESILPLFESVLHGVRFATTLRN